MDIVNVSTNAVVLRNRGFRVIIHKLVRESGSELPKVPYERELNEESEFVLSELWFKFTNATLAEVELPDPFGWGSIEAWGEALQNKPFLTLAKTFALVSGRYTNLPDGTTVPDWRYGALQMLDGDPASYVTVMSAALEMAQGADPEATGVKVKQAIKEAHEKIAEAQAEEAAKADAPDTQTSPSEDSHSKDGSQAGQS